MKLLSNAVLFTALLGLVSGVAAETERDCLMKGTVYKSDHGGEPSTEVKFHSIDDYDGDSRCRMRKGKKLEFQLPADSRLEEAPSGSEVEYRYRTDESGNSSTELIRVGA